MQSTRIAGVPSPLSFSQTPARTGSTLACRWLLERMSDACPYREHPAATASIVRRLPIQGVRKGGRRNLRSDACPYREHLSRRRRACVQDERPTADFPIARPSQTPARTGLHRASLDIPVRLLRVQAIPRHEKHYDRRTLCNMESRDPACASSRRSASTVRRLHAINIRRWCDASDT